MTKTVKLAGAAIVLAASCIFSVVLLFDTGLFTPEGHKMMAAALLALVFVFGFALVSAGTNIDSAHGVLWLAALTAAAVCVRCYYLESYSGDYVSFLADWVQYFRDSGGFRGLGGSVGNYNVTYLYFLALFSYLPLHDLYLIKLLSIVFDFVLAFYVMKIVQQFRGQKLAAAAFFVVLFLPTVVINGAKWAQCDSIYAAFAIGALYYAIKNKMPLSLAFLAIAFSFKMQTVFIMPLWAVFFFTGKLKARWLWVFPAAFVAAVLPALLLGKPFGEIIDIYVGQTEIYAAWLNLNSPSVYALVTPQNLKTAKWMGIAAAFLLCAAVISLAVAAKNRNSAKLYTAYGLLLCIGVPWLLPHMHERYFFIADAMSVAMAFADLKFIPVCVLVQLSSFACYMVYYGTPIISLKAASLLMLAALVLTLVLTVYMVVFRRAKREK